MYYTVYVQQWLSLGDRKGHTAGLLDSMNINLDYHFAFFTVK